jgi:1-acyl-sn-glycerol-3-phosphate acyltransferase
VVPPRIVRRLVFAPLVLLITLTAVVLSPLLALAALIAARSRSGRRRSLRLLWFGLSWLVMESLALVACLGLWIASGFGGRLRTETSLDRHYGLVRWFLATLFRRAIKVFHLRVEIEEPEATPEELAARLTRPVIVLSRHAGPGDSFLLVHHLLSLYRRKPRIVMKAALQLDPSLDVVINRLPHAFVRPRKSVPPRGEAGTAKREEGAPASPAAASSESTAVAEAESPVEGAVSAEIRRLASSLGPVGALVIFPEGGNFTPRRWRRGIAALEEKRRFGEAQRARGMANLLPPRAGGAFAAIDSAPTADVIFVAHTGLDDLITMRDVWRALPMEQVIKAKWWRVPAAEVPRERTDVVAWLYDWWERIDDWIEANRPVRPEATTPAQRTPSPRISGEPTSAGSPSPASPDPSS